MNLNDNDIIEWKMGINKAFGRMYFAIYSIDLSSGLYLEISTLDIFKEHIPSIGEINFLFSSVLSYYVSDGYKEKMREFFDISTIQYRLNEQNAVSEEFFGTTQGWCRASFVVEKRDENGKVVRFAYVTQEINEEIKSEREKITELKEAYKKVDTANKSKSDFLFQMSNDIRTPLNAIIGFEQLIENYADNPDKVLEYASKIKVSSNMLLSLLNKILDMTKIEKGMTVLKNESFKMSDLIYELEIVIKSYTLNKRQSFFVDKSTLVHDNFIGDKACINRVLVNILGNATKYTNEGGIISFVINEEYNENDDKTNVVFTIRDNGIGVSPDLKDHIFEKFVRGENEITSKNLGVGLGLSISKSLIDMMGGSITFTSMENYGTNFVVKIPLKLDNKVEDTSNNINNLEFSILSNLHVLVVEDNDMNMDITTCMLEMAGVLCDKAYSGFEAIEKISMSSENAYDFILMDICMPKMDGYQTTQKIRNMDRLDVKSIPIIALTANSFEEDIKKSISSGMNAHIAKPLNISLLCKTIEPLLNKK